MRQKRLVSSFTWVAVVGAALILLGCEARTAPIVQPNAPLKKVKVRFDRLRRVVRSNGTVEAVNALSIRVPQIEGQGGDMTLTKLIPGGAEVKTGDMLAEFDRTDLANDKKNVPYALNLAYPDYDPSALTAWAWGFHRVVDYLQTLPSVDKSHIAATGHSRGGKAVLLAGALDERIALTNPNDSGCGGAGCYRYQAEKSEDIAAITKSFPFWFVPRFQEFIGQVDKLPFDQHSVKALVAPRALLSTEALGDLWANPSGTQRTHLAAKQVYDFLGAPDKTAIFFREGKHEHNADDWNVLLDFADKTFFNKAVERKFDNLAFPVAAAP